MHQVNDNTIGNMDAPPLIQPSTERRKVLGIGITPRTVTVMNLIFASLAFLISIMGEAGCWWAGSPPPIPHGPITIREVLADSVVLTWFAGAVGLFSRKRLAWVGSLLGVGVSACFFAAALLTTVWLYFYPTAGMEENRAFGVTGYIAALVIIGGMFSMLFALFLGLFIGLLRMRKELR